MREGGREKRGGGREEKRAGEGENVRQWRRKERREK